MGDIEALHASSGATILTPGPNGAHHITEGSMKKYSFTRGARNVHYLVARYDLLVKVFGNDGMVSPRDKEKSAASWDVVTPGGTVRVYDYMPGAGYSPDDTGGRSDIITWHVQGSGKGIESMLSMLDRAEKVDEYLQFMSDVDQDDVPQGQNMLWAAPVFMTEAAYKALRGDGADKVRASFTEGGDLYVYLGDASDA
jgi:hypothetical protein